MSICSPIMHLAGIFFYCTDVSRVLLLITKTISNNYFYSQNSIHTSDSIMGRSKNSNKKKENDNDSTIAALETEERDIQTRLLKIQTELSVLRGEDSKSSSSEVLFPSSKSGYLFKWNDRAIGWGGTKWDLRFVRLHGGKLSYFKSHEDTVNSARYILHLKGCAVRDDGCKPNKRYKPSDGNSQAPEVSTPGAYFHVFSIYQRPKTTTVQFSSNGSSTAESDSDDLIVPLLRFSTPSLAEKNMWVELISDACAYCDANPQYSINSSSDVLSNNPSMDDDYDLNMQFLKQVKNMHTKGTLAPMLFVPPKPPKPIILNRSNSRSTSYKKLNKDQNASRSNSKRIHDYPPSKPMHRTSEPSYLSNEAPNQNYRGLFNLGFLILIVSNFRILIDTMKTYGFVLAEDYFLKQHHPKFHSYHDHEALIQSIATHFPFLFGLVLLSLFINYAYLVELVTSKRLVTEWIGMALHYLNLTLSLLLPMVIVWIYIENTFLGILLLLTSVMTWMKLVSYVHANADYRLHPERDTLLDTLIQNLDDGSNNIVYPQNITLSNIYYFWFAPTLTYQIAFPRTPRINYIRVITLILRLFLCTAIILFLVAQIVSPNLSRMVKDFESTKNKSVFTLHIWAEYLLKLTLASTYIWLIGFYSYFHLFLNVLAELMRFGDRVFYRDWWNSSEVSSYWRLWNLPVHYWLVRHLYFPCIRVGLSKAAAMFIVFFFSAVMHEVLISIPFHMIRPWSFLGMMGQIPLVALTKYIDKLKPGSSIGNFIFWLSFCMIGQPMAILMYTVDRWKLTNSNDLMEYPEQSCKKFWIFHSCNDYSEL